jgi:hypothetical protein
MLNYVNMQPDFKKKKVSYSQYSMWMKCPYSWKLNYLEGKKKFSDSVNTCFGTAIHFVIQTYIQTLYTKSAAEADALNCIAMFKAKFEEELAKAKQKAIEKNDKFEYTDDEYTEFYYNGEDILRTFLNTSTRIKHFPSNKFDFIGVELPLDANLKNNVEFFGLVDLVLKEKSTGKIKIYDFKTSSLGWNKYQVADPAKYEQVLVYKAFYSKKFNVPLSMIDVEFFILKRKLLENVNYPQSHIQLFTPRHNSSEVATAINGFAQFVAECFTPTGEFNLNGKYPKIPGKNKKNCKYCTHLKTTCNGKADKLED